MRIPLNKLVFDIIYWDLWQDYGPYNDVDEYLEYFESFSELFSEDEELDSEDKYIRIKDFIHSKIKVIDEITEYIDLEKGYSENVLIIKCNNKLYGIDFFQSPYAGTELRGCGEFIDERPEYKEVQVTTYQPK